jgi:hypothetical protein
VKPGMRDARERVFAFARPRARRRARAGARAEECGGKAARAVCCYKAKISTRDRSRATAESTVALGVGV